MKLSHFKCGFNVHTLRLSTRQVGPTIAACKCPISSLEVVIFPAANWRRSDHIPGAAKSNPLKLFAVFSATA